MSARPFSVDAHDYPRALKVAREDITVLASGDATGSYEIFLQRGVEGSGPLPHYHPWDEAFYVIKGSVDFIASEGEARTALAGTLVHFPAGTPHSFRWGPGGGEMLSITSKRGAARLFADLDREIGTGPRIPEKVDAIFARHGLTRTGDDPSR
ncbi:MAG TPA: cupin domain-containing protein [Burkholderiales bacterium]|nr:cupin domain-containing protein [Burkholderiales bacterium]